MTRLIFVFALFMTLGFGASVYAMDESSDDLNEEILDQSVIKLVFFGKTGAGKSTAVNACFNFVNQKKWHEYPKFFPIPTEFQDCNVEVYRERAVENHQRGQLEAVTQEPSEYLAEGSGFKVGLIDCPGTGDPRGIGQDSINTIATAEFLADMQYVNAFCVVVKSTINRRTAEEVYCIEQIKTLIPLKARERIFIIVTHDTGGRRNIKTFIQEVGLPTDNIFYFDNFALTKDGHIDVNGIDLQAIHGHNDIDDPFSEPEILGNDGREIAIRTRSSWTKSHRQFNRMIRRAKELGNFSLHDFITIRYLRDHIAECFLKAVGFIESLDSWQAQLQNARIEFANASNASIAKARAAEASESAYEEYLRASIAKMRAAEASESAYKEYVCILGNLKETSDLRWSEVYQADDVMDEKNQRVRECENQVGILRYKISHSIGEMHFYFLRLDGLVMCSLNFQLGNYYDTCIRREPNQIKKELLNRERAVYLELVTQYRELKGQWPFHNDILLLTDLH